MTSCDTIVLFFKRVRRYILNKIIIYDNKDNNIEDLDQYEFAAQEGSKTNPDSWIFIDDIGHIKNSEDYRWTTLEKAKIYTSYVEESTPSRILMRKK